MELSKYEAKLRFAKAFVDLTSEYPINKITIGQIVERVGKNRKTFYVHFADKNELIAWLFRYDIACGLEKYFHVDQLVYNAEGDDIRFADMPFYARNILPDGTINNSVFFEIMSMSLEKHRDYYRKLFSTIGNGELDDYLHTIYTPVIKEDIWYLIDRELSLISPIERAAIETALFNESAVDFLAEFYTGAFISRQIMRIHDEKKNRSIHDVTPFENVIHESMQLMVANHTKQMFDAIRGR